MGWTRFAATGLLLLLPTHAMAETNLERGAYLVSTIMACGSCHSPRDADGKPISARAFSGGLTIDTPAFTATAANITQDRDTGIGSWTDTDIKRSLIEGIRPDHGHLAGVPLAAAMPANFYKALLPADLDAIVLYLRTIAPVHNEVAEPIYKMAVRRDAYPDAENGFSAASFSDPVRHGAYLVTIGHCMECHAVWSRGVSDFKTGLGKGGRPFRQPARPGETGQAPPVIAANITSHPVAGIGAWTDAEIKRAITQGISRNGRQLRPPMAYRAYAGLTDSDLNDIVTYLRTIPPLD